MKDADGNIIREAALSLWGNFRQRALNVAMAEINEKTGLHVEIESLENFAGLLHLSGRCNRFGPTSMREQFQ